MDLDLEYIHEHYVESSDDSSDEEDYTDETAMMQAILEDAKRVEERVLNFKGSQPQQGTRPFDNDGRLLCPQCTT